jgi:hypothetical protein
VWVTAFLDERGPGKGGGASGPHNVGSDGKGKSKTGAGKGKSKRKQ